MGRTFVGYAEDLPVAGSNIEISGAYYRKHNPWVNWQSATPTSNQIPPSLNQPFAAFPADYTLLPTLAIVVPNQNNDMHDGTIAQGDAWLQSRLGAYAQWALTHNSLLVVTWDEDDISGGNRNRIPTILYGAHVREGVVPFRLTLHDLQRTIEDMYGTTHAGAAANVQGYVGTFDDDPQVTSRTFRQGNAGYAGAHDTYIEQAAPVLAHDAGTAVVVDGSPLSQGLVRFDDLFGPGPNQVPAGATIVGAKLVILTGLISSDTSVNMMGLHRMLIPWTDGTTWDALGGGVSANDTDAAAVADFTLLPNVANAWAIFDVTGSVRAWADGSAANYGWVVIPSGTDGWRWVSSEGSPVGDRPLLEVVYVESFCDTIDFNLDGVFPDVQDLADWLLVYGGGVCPNPAGCHNLDFNNDGVYPDQTDLLAFLRVFSGGPC